MSRATVRASSGVETMQVAAVLRAHSGRISLWQMIRQLISFSRAAAMISG